MSLDATRLAQAIKTAMLADPAIGAVDGPALSGMCSAIANSVVNELVANAIVTPAGVPPLVAGPNPVTGTGKVT